MVNWGISIRQFRTTARWFASYPVPIRPYEDAFAVSRDRVPSMSTWLTSVTPVVIRWRTSSSCRVPSKLVLLLSTTNSNSMCYRQIICLPSAIKSEFIWERSCHFVELSRALDRNKAGYTTASSSAGGQGQVESRFWSNLNRDKRTNGPT